VKPKFNFDKAILSWVATGAGIFLLQTSLVFSNPPIGQVWQRPFNWTVPPASAAGTTNGNPAADAQDNVVWQYESVPPGQGLGQPTTGGEAPTAWCTGVPTALTWDDSWFGGAGGWTGGNDISPVIQQTTVIQSLNNTEVPLVRWLNPTPSNITVALSGTLALSWSSANLEQPIDFVMMLQKSDGSTTPLVLGSRKPASFPGGAPAPLILVDLPALQIPAGGSIFYTLRYEDAASQSGWVTLDDSTLTITLKALAAVPLLTDDTAVTGETEPVNVEVLANDKWAPQALPRVSVIAGPVHGAAVVRADQSIDYTPATNYVGTDVLTYQVYDGTSTSIAALTVTVNQPYYLYVSNSGNDTNAGTTWTNALASVEGARNQIRTLRAQNTNPLTNTAVEVVLDDGVYAASHTIIFTAIDSGSPQYPVTYRARNSLLASISGGQILNLNWQPYVAMPGAYMADLSTAGLTQSQLNNIHTLIVNDVLSTRARLPNTGFYHIVSADPNTGHTYNKMNTFTFGNSNGQPNIRSTWTNLTRVEVVSYATWTESRMPIASVDAINSQVHIQGSLPQSWADDYLADYGAYLEPTSPYNQTGATDGTIRYNLENILEGLDTPGEWYMDPLAGKLYYYPLAGEMITNATFVVPVINQLLQITNASNLRFDGLTFCDTDWIMPAAGQPGLGQAISLSTPNPILISGATNVVFANGRVTRTGGGYGIQIQFGATSDAVVNTEFVDNGGGGVMIGGTPGVFSDTTAENGYHSYVADNRVSLNHIHDNNTVWREAAGIIALRNGYNRIAGNTVSNATYSGIAVGWFDSDPLAAGHNQVAWNTISRFGTLLYDLAGIYVLGSQPATTIMGNHISGGLWTSNHLHRTGVNFPSDGTSQWNNPSGPIAGIYTDDTSEGELIDGNIIFNVNQGLFIHDTHDDLYLNNIFADTRPETWATVYAANTQGYLNAGPFWIASSVIAWTRTNPAQAILFDSYAPLPWLVMDWNVYSYGLLTIQSPLNNGLPYLQSVGHDQHALVTTNSLFVSPANNDYRIGISSQPLVLSQGFSADWLLEPVVSAPSPLAQFSTAPTNGFAPLQVVFADASTGGITNWLWSFGDGNTINNSANSNVTYTYAAAGNYTVSLTVSGSGGTNTSTLAGFIVASPMPVIGNVTLTSGHLIFGGTNCPAGVPYRILTSTNVALPLASWLPLATNTFLGDGSYSYTNPNSGAAAFFRLVSP
jgi:PKD domain/Bacterial Ig domain/Right handed beta helix region